MAQAEAEYKDFILFYPTLEESAEAQEKVCMIHYRQMDCQGYFGASEATILSKRGSPRSGSQKGCSFRFP